MIRRTRILALHRARRRDIDARTPRRGVATALGGGGMASWLNPVKGSLREAARLTKAQQQIVSALWRDADVSTRAGANRLLRALGYDPRQFVIQRGARNYAGLKCPGKRWTCTRATRVLQAGGQNVSDCSPPADATVNVPNDCIIVQRTVAPPSAPQRSKDSGPDDSEVQHHSGAECVKQSRGRPCRASTRTTRARPLRCEPEGFIFQHAHYGG